MNGNNGIYNEKLVKSSKMMDKIIYKGSLLLEGNKKRSPSVTSNRRELNSVVVPTTTNISNSHKNTNFQTSQLFQSRKLVNIYKPQSSKLPSNFSLSDKKRQHVNINEPMQFDWKPESGRNGSTPPATTTGSMVGKGKSYKQVDNITSITKKNIKESRPISDKFSSVLEKKTKGKGKEKTSLSFSIAKASSLSSMQKLKKKLFTSGNFSTVFN